MTEEAGIPRKSKALSRNEQDDVVRELCTTNGLNYDEIQNGCGGSITTLEMFFSGYPKLIGLHLFSSLQTLRVTGQSIEKIEGIEHCPLLRELWLCECQIKDIEGLGSNKHLRRLYLYSNQITKIKNLESLVNLEVLWLDDNQITNIEGLETLKLLTELNLSANRIEKIGHSLDGVTNLENLNLSANRISSFKDITQLVRLPNLKVLGLKDPHYIPNPVCYLCNYSTHVLYHLPNLQRLDFYDVSNKPLRDLAECTVVKKKMYYNMRVKTIRRKMADITNYMLTCKNETFLVRPKENMKILVNSIKEIERELESLESDDQEGGTESGTESDKDAKETKASECEAHKSALKKKLEALHDKVKKCEKKCEEIEYFYNDSVARVKQMADVQVHRLMTELETGGNVRFEEGTTADPWYNSCHDLVLSRFCADSYKDLGCQGLNIKKIIRIHNRILRSRFDEKLASLTESPNYNYLSTSKNTSHKKFLEYLFWVWDPEVPGGSSEPSRILEEGFVDMDTYRQLGLDGAVPLTNSVSLADKLRVEHCKKQAVLKPYSDNCPYRQGQLVICKVYIGKSEEALDVKKIVKGFYPSADSVFRPRNQDHGKDSGPPRPSSDNTIHHHSSSHSSSSNACECSTRQCEWYIFDHELVIPEYVVEFDYMTRLQPRSPFVDLEPGRHVPKNQVTSREQHLDEDVMELARRKKSKDKLTSLNNDVLLSLAKVTNVSLIMELNLSGNKLTHLKALQSLPDLKKLVISFNDILKLDDLAHMSIEYLDASFNKITTLDGFKGMSELCYLDMSWNRLRNIRDELAILRKHAIVLNTLDIRNNLWLKPVGLRLRAIGRLKTLTCLDGQPVTEAEATAALRLAAGSRISQVSLLAHSRTDSTRPRSLSLASSAQVLSQLSRNKPDKVGESDNQWYHKVTTLNLDGQHISKLSNLERLENLKWASFNDNDITKIEGLESCSNLEELSLENNCIWRLEGLSKLAKLRRLNLANNFIGTLDSGQLDRLPHLHHLALEGNRIQTLQGLHRTISLIELYVGNNRISNLRDIFFVKNLPNLVILDLCGNPIEAESENYRLFVIYHLRTLKALDGAAIEMSENASAKDTFGGRLTSDFVAERLGHGNFKDVRELDFPNCGIRTVDLGSGDMFLNLRSVNLEHNNLTSFSGLIYLINLRVLCLNHNHIECIVAKPKGSNQKRAGQNATASHSQDIFSPESFTPLLENLEVLHLAYNGIKDMTALQLGRLGNLKGLYLQGNEITKVEGLEGLQDLRELVLDRNKIKSLGEFSFNNQWNLQELHMEENRIKDLSYFSCLESLQRLFLGMNRIQDIGELEKLETLSNMIELSVVSNSVARRLMHRPMLVFRMPNLQIIDGIPVSDEEKAKADLYFMEQQPSQQQMTTVVETMLPGIGQYKTQIPVRVTNMQLGGTMDRTPWSGTIHYAEEPRDDKSRRKGQVGPNGPGKNSGSGSQYAQPATHLFGAPYTSGNQNKSTSYFTHSYIPQEFNNSPQNQNSRNNRR